MSMEAIAYSNEKEKLIHFWIDIVWICFVLFVSPALYFLITFLTEMPVTIFKYLRRTLRSKFSNEIA